MNMNGWDTISVLKIDQVNSQLSKREQDLVMSFDTTWTDGFAGRFAARGNFGPWQITGGENSNIHLAIPIISGSYYPENNPANSVHIAGIILNIEVNLAWIPSAVVHGVNNLQFDIRSVTSPEQKRQSGGVAVLGVDNPDSVPGAEPLANAIVNLLVENKANITYIFAQTGVIDPSIATWLMPEKSTYSYHSPIGMHDNGYLAILSVTTDRDISSLNANIDSELINSNYDIALAISEELFLEYVILPMLSEAFPGTTVSNFVYANGQISLVKSFDMQSIREGAIDYVPAVTSLSLTVNDNALKNLVSGSCGLDLPDAYIDFSVTTNNVLSYNAESQTFTFLKDPNPVSRTNENVPWYDYLIGLGALGAAIIAIVMAEVTSAVTDSLSSSDLAGDLSKTPASAVQWNALDQIIIKHAELNTAFLLYGSLK